MADIIQIRRDTAATWTSVNPLLANGEMGYETDTNKFKVGNGVDVWSLLEYHQAEFTPDIFTGAGTEGYVPDPLTEQDFFLRDDGTWQPAAGGGGGQVDTVVGGTDITVDSTDPVNPIVNFSGEQFTLPPNDGHHYAGVNTGNTFTWDRNNLNDLSDVELAALQDGQTLVYNSAQGFFFNQDPYTFTPDIFAGAGTTGYVPDPLTEQEYFLRDDGSFQPAPVSPIGGVSMAYDFSTSTAPPAGDGDIQVNNVDQTLATELYVSSISDLGNDLGFVWETVQPGDYIAFWETVGNNESDYYLVTGPGVLNGTTYTFPISFVYGTGGIENNRSLEVFLIKDPANRIPDGGVDGDVLTKQSGANYDTEWEAPKWVETVVGGTDITVDATDPINPIVNYTGAGGGGGIPEAPNDGLPYVRQGEAWTRGVYSAGSIVNMALVTSLPGTPDANTLYFVTG